MPDCRGCGAFVHASAQTCPQCGCHKPGLSRAGYVVDRVILLVCLAALGLGALVWFVL